VLRSESKRIRGNQKIATNLSEISPDDRLIEVESTWIFGSFIVENPACAPLHWRTNQV